MRGVRSVRCEVARRFACCFRLCRPGGKNATAVRRPSWAAECWLPMAKVRAEYGYITTRLDGYKV
jgi:hypothetical protein